MYANTGYEGVELPSQPPPYAKPPSMDPEYGHFDQSSLSAHANRRQADSMGYRKTEQQIDLISQPQEHNDPDHYHHLDLLDKEMVAEAQEDGHDSTGPESHEKEDAELEKSLAWIPKSGGHPVARSRAPLLVCYIRWWSRAKLSN